MFLNSSHLILVLISSQTDLTLVIQGFSLQNDVRAPIMIFDRENVLCVCFSPLFSVTGHWASPKSRVYMETDSCPLHKGPRIKITQDCLNITLIQFVPDSNLIVIYISTPTPSPQWGDRSMELSAFWCFCCNPTRIAICLE